MRWIFAGVPLVALSAYFGWAYLTLYQLDQALRDQDVAVLNELVDWDSVGYRLEEDLHGLFGGPGEDSDEDLSVTEALLGLFSNLLVGPIADFYASPEGLAYLLNAQIILENPQELLDAEFPEELSWYDHISVAYPTGPASFRAHIVYPENEQRALNGNPLVLELWFRDFHWQLAAVDLPLDALQTDLDGDK